MLLYFMHINVKMVNNMLYDINNIKNMNHENTYIPYVICYVIGDKT